MSEMPGRLTEQNRESYSPDVILAQLTFLFLCISVNRVPCSCPLPILTLLVHSHMHTDSLVFVTSPNQLLYFRWKQTFYVYLTTEIVLERPHPPVPTLLTHKCTQVLVTQRGFVRTNNKPQPLAKSVWLMYLHVSDSRDGSYEDSPSPSPRSPEFTRVHNRVHLLSQTDSSWPPVRLLHLYCQTLDIVCEGIWPKLKIKCLSVQQLLLQTSWYWGMYMRACVYTYMHDVRIYIFTNKDGGRELKTWPRRKSTSWWTRCVCLTLSSVVVVYLVRLSYLKVCSVSPHDTWSWFVVHVLPGSFISNRIKKGEDRGRNYSVSQ